MIIYNLDSGVILANIPYGQPYDNLEGNNSHIVVDDIPNNWYEYKVINNELIKMSNVENEELRIYNRILSIEERFEKEMLNKLKPSHEEIKKAENTIEILSLLQEVL